MYTDWGDILVGSRIICITKKYSDPTRVSTSGRHNCQRLVAYGTDKEPSYAVIDQPVSNFNIANNSRPANEHYLVHDEIRGEEIVGIFEEFHSPSNMGKKTRLLFRGNPATATINKVVKWIGR